MTYRARCIGRRTARSRRPWLCGPPRERRWTVRTVARLLEEGAVGHLFQVSRQPPLALSALRASRSRHLRADLLHGGVLSVRWVHFHTIDGKTIHCGVPESERR